MPMGSSSPERLKGSASKGLRLKTTTNQVLKLIGKSEGRRSLLEQRRNRERSLFRLPVSTIYSSNATPTRLQLRSRVEALESAGTSKPVSEGEEEEV